MILCSILTGKGENNEKFRFADEDDFPRASAMEASTSEEDCLPQMYDHGSEYSEEDSSDEWSAEDTDEEMDDVVCN